MDNKGDQLDLYELLGVDSNISHEELLFMLFSKKEHLTIFGKIKEGIILNSLVDKSFKELYDDYKKLSIIDREKIIDRIEDKQIKKIKDNIFFANRKYFNFFLFLTSATILGISFIFKNNYSYAIDILSSIVLFTSISVILSKIEVIEKNKIINFSVLTLLNILIILVNFSNIFSYLYFILSSLLLYLYFAKTNIIVKDEFEYKENYLQLSNNLKLYNLECKSSAEDKFIATISFIIWKKLLGVHTVSDSILCGPASIISISAILARLSGSKVERMPYFSKELIYNQKDDLLIKQIISQISEKYGANKVNSIIYEIIADLTYGGGGDDRLTIFANKLLLTID
jgi:hypothetical protein